MKYSRTVTNLLPSPYQTNCLNYTRIGCKSRSDCIDKCHIEMSLKQCNSLPLSTNIGPILTDIHRHNDKYQFSISLCSINFNYSICEDKYNSPDCTNDYYSFKLIMDSNFENLLNEPVFDGVLSSLNVMGKLSRNDSDLLTHIKIVFGDEPDTIYSHSPQQYPVEFICFIGGVISLWTGFSIISTYAKWKRFTKRQNHVAEVACSLLKRKTKSYQLEEKEFQ